MVLATDQVDSSVYNRIFPSDEDLWVMDDDSQTQMAIRAYQSLGRGN